MGARRMPGLAALALAGCVLTTVGCSRSEHTGAAIPDSTMIAVLVDLHLAGARQQLPGDAPAGLRDSVLAHHGLDSSAFASHMAWLEAHPDDYVSVYGAVVDRLNAERKP